MLSANPRIAVIGAGCSGSLLALRLLRHCPPATEVILIERSREPGSGLAYATQSASHLLNVPAGNMSALPDDPANFVRWLQNRPDEPGGAPTAATFAPRRLFGAYLRELLETQKRGVSQERLTLLHGEAVSIDRTGSAVTLTLNNRAPLVADIAILATGNAPPAPLRHDGVAIGNDILREDPWHPDALGNLDPHSPVLLIGTGLTMIDMVISLLDQGHAGPIHALSRRGLLPRQHAASPHPVPADPSGLPGTLSALTRQIRRDAAVATAVSGNWRAAIDGLRPFTQDLWQMASPEDRARFLRHLRPWWDVHRHRIAAPIAERIDAARARGQLRVHAGRMADCRRNGATATIGYRPRGTNGMAALEVARVVNCTGPSFAHACATDPLLRHLLQNGIARRDALDLGLDVSAGCALVTRAGAMSQQLFAVGPITRGRFWEVTAVPDIRAQCERLALHLGVLLRTKASARPVLSPARTLLPAM